MDIEMRIFRAHFGDASQVRFDALSILSSQKLTPKPPVRSADNQTIATIAVPLPLQLLHGSFRVHSTCVTAATKSRRKVRLKHGG